MRFIELATAQFLIHLKQQDSNIIWFRPHKTQEDWTEILVLGAEYAETYACPYPDLRELLQAADQEQKR